jgi:hypothetical protein
MGGLRGMGAAVFCSFCHSEGCLCQGLQEAAVVYSWYSRLVSRGECVGRRDSVMTGGWQVGGKMKTGERVDEKGQKECLGGRTMDCSTQEKVGK